MTLATARTAHPVAPALTSSNAVPARHRDGRARSSQARPTVTTRFPLAAPAWSQWHDVLVPARDGLDGPAEGGAAPAAPAAPAAVAVVLGPTGVHVVTRPGPGAASDLMASAARAKSAATAVASALPPRYRGAVTAALVDETAGDGRLVDGVVVATTPGLVEAIRLRPRVLSRSETGVLTGLLSRVLVPEVTHLPRAGLWGRLTRWSRGPRDRAA